MEFCKPTWGEVAELSGGRVRLKIGGLYGVLDRLAAEGLIEPDREEAHDGRLRRYYRDKWEQDMVAAFLDSWLTGDPYDDECILEVCKPTWPEVASVVALAARLYLGGAATPRRYFAWGQAVRRAVRARLGLTGAAG